MAKLVLSLCFLLFSGCCFAFSFREQPQQNECQIQRLNALKPDNRIESEGGFIETWNPNNKPFQCAGVALSRCTLNRNALRRPSYTNAPQEIYIQQGSGIFGMIFPGCPSTFEEPQQKGQSSRPQDRHQKIYHFREGDLIAVPTGFAYWMYNNEDTPVVAVSLIDTNSFQNQLDQMPRRFYLAGNQEQEFLQYQPQKQQGGTQSQKGKRQQEEENEGGSILSGFAPEFLEHAFVVDRQIVRKLQGENEEEEKGAIVTVKGGLSVISPPTEEQQQRPEEEEKPDCDEKDKHCQSQSRNGIDETICTMRLRHNIGQTSSPDIFNPQAGSITTATSLDFPALSWLKLSAQFGSLRKNAMFVPHYNLNANSIIYALNGRALVQVVNCNGERVFDGELQEGQVLIVPQNFAVAARSQSDNFEYVSFKTNDRPSIGNLAGANSLLNALPEEVIQQTFNLRRQQARQVKNNNPFSFLVPPKESQRRVVA
ncbi:hypothetical protein AAZX31_19G150900 [Glycine max]|uniref:Glycinin G3 n=3 Tax=Glycine subgen. Soja TaxID=1462606 RepID=GLYG3_SOYBN|nr:glycinin G3 precursor [Glycine max]XP_028217268.1 glycinin G3 [Glycine soja]XP_040868361.1 glycinin G3 isoform X1 [Glycine max]P11828.1 RecName: Full=Glycinin G3; Short=Glycinin 11S G3; Short=Glycinin A1bB2; AltName: Allergen=Gly m 6; Contains: RecName: Full=Glycinin A1b subunit; AltName: Full=Glycinin A subunit; Contains: RecName: Full=Glycinin B2 subunit; AltName: Full=Glycinin B subunit; Flags: Precursor [Glycine max]KAG4396334.1 hypothetical protein GLYMA_19G164900v4 [Glycine max]KAG491|eukprot:NP_001236840.2 glycinin G3 precursor [Glycine max]